MARLLSVQGFESLSNARAQFVSFGEGGAWFEQHKNIQGRQVSAHGTKRLAQKPFQLVATGGSLGDAFADRET